MPKLQVKLTDSRARAISPPATGYEIHWCGQTPGFGVRVTAAGARSWVLERWVNGKTIRRTLGHLVGRGEIGVEAARRMSLEVHVELDQGHDRKVVKQAERKAERQESAADALTLEKALGEYVKGKRRGKDGLPLKERTKADYLAMVAAPGMRKSGEPFLGGALHTLADVPLAKITAQQMRDVYNDQAKRSQRQAVYSMQVLRACLNWHGVQVPDSPLAKATAGKQRIVLPATVGNPKPIPPERLGAWWRAACARTGDAANGLMFQLLTGARPGELFGSEHVTGLVVGDCDLEGGRVTLIDTKNRSDHVVILSTQALAILVEQCKGKKSGAKVFDVLDPGKTLKNINAEAGTQGITAHKLRHTFASVAEELVSGYALKRMVNHAGGAADVTGTHYVGKSETQLRAAWQTVADFIVGAAAVVEPAPDIPAAKPARSVRRKR